jgi:hypothetical protein
MADTHFQFKGIDLKNIIKSGNTSIPGYNLTTVYPNMENSKPFSTNYKYYNNTNTEYDDISTISTAYYGIYNYKNKLNVPSGVTACRLIGIAGGGGGGGRGANSSMDINGPDYGSGENGGNGGAGGYVYGRIELDNVNDITITVGAGGAGGNNRNDTYRNGNRQTGYSGGVGGGGGATIIKIGDETYTAKGGNGGAGGNGGTVRDAPWPSDNTAGNGNKGSSGNSGNSSSETNWDNAALLPANTGRAGSGSYYTPRGGQNNGQSGTAGKVQIIWLYGSDPSFDILPPTYEGYELVPGNTIAGYNNVFTGGQYVKSVGYCLVLEKNGILKLIEGNSPIGQNIVWSSPNFGYVDGTTTAQWDPNRGINGAFTIVYNKRVIWDAPQLPANKSVGFGGALVIQGNYISLQSDNNSSVWSSR